MTAILQEDEHGDEEGEKYWGRGGEGRGEEEQGYRLFHSYIEQQTQQTTHQGGSRLQGQSLHGLDSKTTEGLRSIHENQ